VDKNSRGEARVPDLLRRPPAIEPFTRRRAFHPVKRQWAGSKAGPSG
jgi:hypothetical protein